MRISFVFKDNMKPGLLSLQYRGRISNPIKVFNVSTGKMMNNEYRTIVFMEFQGVLNSSKFWLKFER